MVLLALGTRNRARLLARPVFPRDTVAFGCPPESAHLRVTDRATGLWVAASLTMGGADQTHTWDEERTAQHRDTAGPRTMTQDEEISEKSALVLEEISTK